MKFKFFLNNIVSFEFLNIKLGLKSRTAKIYIKVSFYIIDYKYFTYLLSNFSHFITNSNNQKL